MKPSFVLLKENHYSSNKLAQNFVDGAAVYQELGYDIAQLIQQNPGYVNTCAVRMSLALIKSGVIFAGRLPARSAQFTGKTIEPGAKLLADQLARPNVFGRPQILKPTEAIAKLQGKKGVIFFWRIVGYDGGHIDLIEPDNTSVVCHSGCYFAAREIWFWPL